ncbi:MAG: hypothetical protein WB646_09170 [Steroidobacteraceae bacterium]
MIVSAWHWKDNTLGNGGRPHTTITLFLAFAILALIASPSARADTFASVHYDARTDELVATMIYRGTNPHHAFTLQWGACRQPADSHGPQEIAADVLDSQWNDSALQSYRQTVRFSLASLSCRPAKVTLRTAPRFLYTVFVPRAPVRLP